MKNLTLTIVAALALGSASANATPMCEAQVTDAQATYSYEIFDNVSDSVVKAYSTIDAMEASTQPGKWVGQMTVGNGGRAVVALMNASEETVTYLERLIDYTVDTGACVYDAPEIAPGVNCVIQTPNKIISLSLTKGAGVVASIIGGVYEMADNTLGAFGTLSSDIASAIGPFGAPLVVVSGATQLAGAVLKVVVLDIAVPVLTSTASGAALILCTPFEAADALLRRGELGTFVKTMTIGLVENAWKAVKGVLKSLPQGDGADEEWLEKLKEQEERRR